MSPSLFPIFCWGKVGKLCHPNLCWLSSPQHVIPEVSQLFPLSIKLHYRSAVKCSCTAVQLQCSAVQYPDNLYTVDLVELCFNAISHYFSVSISLYIITTNCYLKQKKKWFISSYNLSFKIKLITCFSMIISDSDACHKCWEHNCYVRWQTPV